MSVDAPPTTTPLEDAFFTALPRGFINPEKFDGNFFADIPEEAVEATRGILRRTMRLVIQDGKQYGAVDKGRIVKAANGDGEAVLGCINAAIDTSEGVPPEPGEILRRINNAFHETTFPPKPAPAQVAAPTPAASPVTEPEQKAKAAQAEVTAPAPVASVEPKPDPKADPKITVLETMNPRTVNELLLDRSTPTPVSIVEKILIAATLLLIAGAPKVGKTWLAILLALCIVSGRPFLGFAIPQRRRVLYLGGEGSDATLRKRFEAALAFFPGVEEVDLDNLLILSTSGRVKYDTPAGQDAIRRMVQEADVAMIDPAFRFQSRGDENSHADARAIQDFLDELKAAGKTVVVVHHTRKAGPVDGGIAEIRGAGWGEFADSAIVLQRKKADSVSRFILKFDLRHDEPVDDLELAKEGPLFTVADVGKRLVTSDDVVQVLIAAGGRVEGRTALIEALVRRTGCTPASSTPKEAILKAERDGKIESTTLPGAHGRSRVYFMRGIPKP